MIARRIRRAHDELGYRYRDIAILCRGRVSLPPILEALDATRHPGPAGRPDEPVPAARGATCSAGPLPGSSTTTGAAATTAGSWVDESTLDDLLDGLPRRRSASTARSADAVRAQPRRLEGPRRTTTRSPRTSSASFYELLGELGVDDWDLDDPLASNRSARSPAARSSSPTTRPRGAARGPTTTNPASRSAARIAASGTTSGSRSTSRTGRTAPTRTSRARTTSTSTPST